MNGAGPTLRRVLCALDVESSTKAPLSIASAFAHGFRASVDALYAPAPLLAFGGRAERVRRLIAEHGARERLQAMLVPFASSLQIESYVTRGPAEDVILAHSQQHQSDLIVLGCQNGTSERGGVSLPVVSAANCAVLTVRRQTPEVALRRVLLPLGSALAAEPASDWALALAGRFGAEITVVPVANVPGFWRTWTGSAWSAADRRGQKRLLSLTNLVMSRLSAAGVSAKLHPEPSDAAGVVSMAAEGGYDLVALGLPPAGDAASDGEALARALRRRSDVPVLSVRARGVRARFARGQQSLLDLPGEGYELGIPA